MPNLKFCMCGSEDCTHTAIETHLGWVHIDTTEKDISEHMPQEPLF